ncbi:MAG: ABC transporter substrate-binding protein [Saprospiraceae bacterium]|nr:ABC transporter substrate-binding protein [Saprospiraceae bacterium]
MKNCYFLAICISLVLGCNSNVKQDTNEAAQATAADPTQAIPFTAQVQPKYAKHFTVDYHDSYKLVRTHATFYPNGKEGDSKNREDVLVLVQKGSNPPPLTGELADAHVLYVPAATVAVNVQHSESFLRELGLVDRINAIGGLFSYDTAMRTKALEDKVGQVGYSWHSPPNIEVLLTRQPELFLMTLASMSHTESLEKCRQLDVPTAAVFDWAEQDYLARAEWLKFYALFFNAEEKANQVFQVIEDRVQELKQLAASTGGGSALWGYHGSKGRWVMQLESFPAQYLRDANLDNVLLSNTVANANGIQTLSTEQLLVRGQAADHWVIGDIHASPLPKEEIMSSFAAWKQNQLYHNMERVDPKSNSSDWYATAIVRPDSVLADLISLVYPDVLPDHQAKFMGVFNKADGAKAPVQ